ncbi:MAG: hypothetical protein KDC98_01620, partial [Planctomycetes bacterium]|nr:hypothetical protein [Planctomycetota bacterium]
GCGSWANGAQFQIPGNATFASKQVVVLQARGPDPLVTGPNADQDIRWQSLFYGDSGLWDPIIGGPIGRTATNARAVSVWPVWKEATGELDQEETRIAICGETYDSRLPNNQFNGTGGWNKFYGPIQFHANYPRGLPSGFIAVYPGNGQFLWSHQFFFEDASIPPGSPEGACAITDCSIRVEQVGEVKRDVVTYCGISSFGLRTNETTALTADRSYTAPTSTVTNYVPGGGATDNSNDGAILDQWDGIVGRISNLHSLNPVPGSATTKEFHAVVGGTEQDGLWGLIEMRDDRFCVVGGTATTRHAVSGGATFPFTNNPTINWNGLTDYCVGTLLVFDASDTRNTSPPMDLILETSSWLGNASALVSTHASDVAVHFDGYGIADPAGPILKDRIAVVGTTTDDQLFASFATGGVSPTIGFVGGREGFLATAIDRFFSGGTPADVFFAGGSFQGDNGNGRWVGVGSWNEYVDHLAVVGEAPGSGQDLQVASFFVDTPTPLEHLIELRSDVIVTTPVEEVAVMGAMKATAQVGRAGLDYEEFGLGSRAGGGVAMDERGRVNVVGSTDSSGFPAIGGPLARGYLSGQDAVRAVVTMLPPLVGRTDGTGTQVHHSVPIPAVPPGMTGATTPTCALLPFGTQIVGMAPPALHRMMIDWEGPGPQASPIVTGPSGPTPVSIHWLLIDRPPFDTNLLMTVVQFGVPTPPAALVLGIENWVPSGAPITGIPNNGPTSYRVPLKLPPGTGMTFSAQVATFLVNPLSCTGAQLASTPTIVFSY